MKVEKIDILKEYESALELLDQYDHQTLKKPEGRINTCHLDYEACRNVIESMSFAGKSEWFGKEKEEGKLESILSSISQTVFGEEIYDSMEEMAANLLYFLIKDHPFVDGCKRIATALFLEFLNQNGALKQNNKMVIHPNTLAVLVILIAESRPEEKDMMICLIMNLLFPNE